QRICDQNARAPQLLILPPPIVNVVSHALRLAPAEDRQAEGTFGNERVALDQLKWLAGRIGLQLVIATEDPDFAAALDAHLGRSEHVSGRMQRDANAGEVQE